MPAPSARSNLRQILYYLRQIIPEVAGSNGANVHLIVANRQEIQLNPQALITVDVQRFEALLDSVQVHDHLDSTLCFECAAALQDAVDLYRDGFLTNFFLDDSDAFEEWAQARRDHYRRRVLDALSLLTSISLQRQEYGAAQALAEKQLAIDNLREIAYRQLMEVLALGGQREQALAVYATCRRVLADSLAMAPTIRTTEFYEKIHASDWHFEQDQERGIRGYELQERLTDGAYGAIYRAVQPSVQREVAIKVISRRHANDPAFIRRFEVEAQTIARLEHPHIVPLYDYWRDPRGAYLVMRYMRGGSLLDALRSGPWDVARTAAMVEQISSALAVAHQQGVVHRDIKPGNILLDEAGNAYLADFGIAKSLAARQPLTAEDTVLGTLDYASPEQIMSADVSPQTDIYSLGAVLYETLTGERPFGDAAVARLLYSQLNDPIPLVTASRPDVAPEVDAVLQIATAKQATDRYASVLQMAAAFRHAIHDKPWPVANPERESATVPLEVYNPYKGLHAFQEFDADDFYGRDALVRQLVSRLAPADSGGGSRFLALIGPSGSGKSSAVRAGLIPALRSGTLPGSDRWFITEMVPGSDPLEELEKALWRVAVDPPPNLVEPMRRDSGGILRTIRRVLPTESALQQDPPQLVLVIDQFEELFTLVETEPERVFFLNSLLEALEASRSPLRVIVTLRADFYDRPLQYHAWGQLLKQHTEVILPLNRAELIWAVREPAQRLGVRLEDGLDAAIAADIADQPGALPLLQYALTELFDARRGKRMTWDAYHAIGGVLGALGRRAEEIFGGLDEPARSAARQLFLRLVTYGDGPDYTRRRVLHGELTAINLPGIGVPDSAVSADSETTVDVIDRVIGAFAKGRLLTLDRDPVTRDSTVEVAHEALFQQWARLQSWLSESRQDLEQQRQLARATREWRAAEEDTSFLLSGLRLQSMEQWASKSGMALTATERAFLQASAAGHQHALAAAAARKAREAALERRSRIVLRGLVVVLGLSTLLGIILTLYAFSQRDNAQRVRLAAQAQSALDNGEDMALPALLAIQSLQYAYSPEADAALLGALGRGFTQRFIGHTDSLASIVFSPDGRYVLTAANDATARLWDAQSGQELGQFVGHTELVTRAIFAPDGDQIVTSSADRTVRFWVAATGLETGRLPRQESPVWALAYSPDGGHLLTGDESGLIRLWDARTLQEVWSVNGHSDVVLSADFTPDGRHIATGSLDATAGIWSAATGEEVRRIAGHAAAVRSVDVSPDGRWLVTASSDNLARLWDLASGVEGPALIGHSNDVNEASFSPDGQWVVTSSDDGTVRIWDAVSGTEMNQYVRQVGRVNATSFSPDGQHLLSAASDPIGRMWNIRVVSEPRTYVMPFRTMHSSDVVLVGFAADEQLILVGSGNGVVVLRDIRTGRTVEEHLFDTDGLFTTLAYAPDHQTALTGDGEGRATLWDVGSGQKIRTFAGHDGAIWDLAFAADGRFVLTGSEDGTARLWNARTGVFVREFSGHTAPVQAVAFSEDGSRILTGSEDGTARLWDPESGAELRQFRGHSATVQAIAFSLDGSAVLTGSADGTAWLWDSTTGAVIHQFMGHSAAIRAVAFAPNGEAVVTGSNDGTARLWDITSGAVVRQFSGHTGPIRRLVFSSDGSLLVTAENRATYLWQTEMGAVIAAACAQLLRDFTAAERSFYDIGANTSTCD